MVVAARGILDIFLATGKKHQSPNLLTSETATFYEKGNQAWSDFQKGDGRKPMKEKVKQLRNSIRNYQQ